ncbi:hypothetical protein [Ostreiculturibacter nitratireducens]|uniref:hypothetical protein n=1 Tax=Ostreiculturibacter nitratireducens TaxID=3075226 RepID=UPI0031B58413
MSERIRAARAAAAHAVQSRNSVAPAARVGLVGLGPAWRVEPDVERVAKWGVGVLGREAILITSGTEIALFQIPGVITERIPYDDAAPDRDRLYAARRLTDLFWKWRIGEILPLDAPSADAWEKLRNHATEPDGWPPMRMVNS